MVTRASGCRRMSRFPADNLEGLVVGRLRKLFADQGELLDTVTEHASSGIGTRQLIERAD